MWQQITTFSELDLVVQGTLLSKDNPEENVDADIYRVVAKNEDIVSITTKTGNDPSDVTDINPDILFTEGWWMQKVH